MLTWEYYKFEFFKQRHPIWFLHPLTHCSAALGITTLTHVSILITPTPNPLNKIRCCNLLNKAVEQKPQRSSFFSWQFVAHTKYKIKGITLPEWRKNKNKNKKSIQGILQMLSTEICMDLKTMSNFFNVRH